MSEANHSLKRASYLSLILSLRNIHIAYNKCRNMACILLACMCYVLLLGLNLNLYMLTSCRLHSGQCKDQLAMHGVCAVSFLFTFPIKNSSCYPFTRYFLQHTYVPVVPQPCTERSSKKGGGNWGLRRINKNMPIKRKGSHARFLCTHGH